LRRNGEALYGIAAFPHPASRIPLDMEILTTLPALPPRPLDGHKGTFGRVLVVGGDDEMIGAPVLAGTAALRAGSGLVQLAIPRSIVAAALSITPELIALGLGRSGGKRKLLEAAEKADVIVVGPGLGQSPQARERLQRLVKLADKPLVVDADGLNLLARHKAWPAAFKAKAVLTPHPGEMARLGALIGRTTVPPDDEGRRDLAAAAARAFGQVVLLKGSRTVVTDGQRVYVNTTGNSALSKAGTGDVLSGVIGSLMGQGMTGFDAACLGAHLHGRAGEIAGERLGLRSVLAREVIDALPEAIRELSLPSTGARVLTSGPAA
jgi:ADP-dependent NAD(P)H-hydrate dehydratase